MFGHLTARTAFLLVLIILASLFVGYSSAAPPSPRAYAPFVARPLAAPDLATVLECSCGYAGAATAPDGRIFVIVQDFARGGRLYVYVDNGVTFQEAIDPGLVGPPADAASPSFAFPAQKNGPGGITFTQGPNVLLVIVAPARPVGVVEGPYNLMRYRAPLSSIP